MENYGIVQAIYKSFYSKPLYRNVAAKWGGKAFVYLLTIITFTWVITVANYQYMFWKKYDYYMNLTTQVPDITIKNGVASTPENRPYFIEIPGWTHTFAVIDVTGKYTSLAQTNSTILITKDKMISQRGDNVERVITFDNKTEHFNAQTLQNLIKMIFNFLWIPALIIGVIFLFIYRVIQALLYALFGKLIAMVTGVNLTYSQILQISMIAITPAMLLDLFFSFFNIEFRGNLFLLFVLSMGYLFYGIQANKNT